MPWFAVMLFGYAFGSWLQLPAASRSRRSLRLCLALCVGFVLLRARWFLAKKRSRLNGHPALLLIAFPLLVLALCR